VPYARPNSTTSVCEIAAERCKVQCIKLSSIEGFETAKERQDAMLNHAFDISDAVSSLASSSRYLTILTGTLPFRSKSKRQEKPSIATTAAASFQTTTVPTSPSNSTGGILAHYQLLTPGLLTALLITLGTFLPLLLIGICALGSIKISPYKTEARAMSGDKKNQ